MLFLVWLIFVIFMQFCINFRHRHIIVPITSIHIFISLMYSEWVSHEQENSLTFIGIAAGLLFQGFLNNVTLIFVYKPLIAIPLCLISSGMNAIGFQILRNENELFEFDVKLFIHLFILINVRVLSCLFLFVVWKYKALDFKKD
jgi:hypothetical protein